MVDRSVDVTAKLRKLCEATVVALAHKDAVTLYRLVQSFSHITPTKDALLETGAGKLLNDAFLWAQAQPNAVSLAAATLQKWKKQVREAHG